MKNKFYITTSIAYVNALPHLGYALELIQADVISRYQRTFKKDVFFLTGTDEHGEKIFKKAKEIGKEPQEFVDEMSFQFKKLTESLNISNDDFIRTTDKKRHIPTVKKVWLKLKENGDIYKKKYKGFYCVGCEKFLLKKDLINGKCPYHLKKPEIIEEENYFLKLSKYQKKIKKIIEDEKIKIIPEKRKNEILSFLNEGLDDISVSRPKEKVSWGIPVPNDESQTIYVWVDALINYISAIGYNKNLSKFKKYWPADVHCIGKDIYRFHAIIWPIMLLSLKLPCPKNIFIHGFITSKGQKMSKSLGNIINPFDLIEKYGADPVRYFLLREIPPTEDGDFTYEKFEKRYNSDLSSGLGNLVSRVVSMEEKFGIKKSDNKIIQKEIKKIKKEYHKLMKEFKFNTALESIWELIKFSDKYIDKEKPWENKKKAPLIIGDLIIILNEINNLIYPFLPETYERIKKQIKTKKSEILFPKTIKNF